MIPVLGMGGAEKMCADLSIELTRLGNEVIVISLYNEHTDISRQLEKNNVKVYYLNKKTGFDIKCIFQLRKIITEFNPDVIHTHLYSLKYAFLASVGKSIPVIRTIHNIAEKELGKSDKKVSSVLFKMRYAIPVAISTRIKKTIVDSYNLPSNSIPVVQNGIPLNQFEEKKEYNLHIPCKIVHVGRFQEQKNHICIIESARELINYNVKFLLIGDGELKETIEKKAQEYHIDDKIEFVGQTTDVNSYLKESDIFILPSKWEGLPISIIEAMAVGLPIIASDVGGVSDLIQSNQNGLLIKPQSNQLIEAIKKLLGNDSIRKKYGENAKRTSLLFSVEKMAMRYLSLYKRTLNG